VRVVGNGDTVATCEGDGAGSRDVEGDGEDGRGVEAVDDGSEMVVTQMMSPD